MSFLSFRLSLSHAREAFSWWMMLCNHPVSRQQKQSSHSRRFCGPHRFSRNFFAALNLRQKPYEDEDDDDDDYTDTNICNTISARILLAQTKQAEGTKA